MDFGKRLREARERAGLTQQEAADRARVVQPAWCRYERGRVMPSIPVAQRLAKAVKRPLADLIA